MVYIKLYMIYKEIIEAFERSHALTKSILIGSSYSTDTVVETPSGEFSLLLG